MSSRKEEIQQILSAGCESRLFLGYAGWSGGQLDEEIESGGWLSAAADSATVFTSDIDQLWKDTTEKIGMDILASTMLTHRLPPDPNSN